MQLSLRDNLPFVAVTIAYSGHTVEAKHVLIDTGSATTILAADVVAKIQVVPSPVSSTICKLVKTGSQNSKSKLVVWITVFGLMAFWVWIC